MPSGSTIFAVSGVTVPTTPILCPPTSSMVQGRSPFGSTSLPSVTLAAR